MTERWAPVPGWEGRYEVSNLGAVRTVARVIKRGAVEGMVQSKELRPQPSGRDGSYLRVSFKRNRKRKWYRIHQLVMLAFVGPQPDWAVICHKNDVSHDNRAENLYYGTLEENQLDRYVNSLPLDHMEEAPF